MTRGHDHLPKDACGGVDYLRISVTDRCNFRCGYCMPPEGVPPLSHGDILSYEEIARFTAAAAAAGIRRVRLTGGEPLVRRGLSQLVAALAAVPGVSDLAMTTNGSLLAQHAAGLRAAGLKRINISIDSLNPGRFAGITGGARLEPVLAGLEAALAAGFDPVKINVVAMAGIERELGRFAALCREYPVHVRFIELMPVGRGRVWSGRFVSRGRLLAALEAALGREPGIRGGLMPAAPPVGAGPARYYRFAGAAGSIGFIGSVSEHFCRSCNRLRLTADGRLLGCLFSGDELDVRPYIVAGGREQLSRLIAGVISRKKYDRYASGGGRRQMSQIGG